MVAEKPPVASETKRTEIAIPEPENHSVAGQNLATAQTAIEAEQVVYKVQATLQDFSTEGRFQIAYRTLVRLVGDDTAAEREQLLATANGRSSQNMLC